MSKKRKPLWKPETPLRDVAARWADPHNPQMPLCYDCWNLGGKHDLGYSGWTGLSARHILRHSPTGLQTSISFCGIDFSGQHRGTQPGQGRLIHDS